MSRLTEIRNEFAKEKAYKDWDHFIEINQWKHGIVQGYMDEVAKRYAEECAKASLEKAYQESLIDGNSQSRCGCEINKESITNPENIFLL